MAARGAALNPTSLPFFPGGIVRSEEDQSQGGATGDDARISGLAFRLPSGHIREDYMSSSSTSDYRSFRSSPSPPYPTRTDSPESTRSQSKENYFTPKNHVQDTTPYSLNDSRGAYGTSADGDVHSTDDANITAGDTPIPAALSLEYNDPDGKTPGSEHIRVLRPESQTDNLGVSDHSNPVTILASMSSSINANMACSPASSAGDSNMKAFTSSDLHSLEAQLKASPFINDILDRIVRCELSAREIRRELGDLHRKVNNLIDRPFTEPTFRPTDRSVNSSEPTFRNPFTSSASTITAPVPLMNGPVSYANGGASGHTPSSRSQDEIAQMSQRLNTLTTSVSQLLALQTQQHMQHMNTGFQSPQGLPPNVPPGNHPESISSPPAPAPAPSMPGPHTLPSRPDLRPSTRTPNPPMRTWSAGSLDLPMRPPDANLGLGRPEAFLRDKRRSVASLMRRDSGSVRSTSSIAIISRISVGLTSL